MQRCKRRTRYRNPKSPEKVMAMHICEELATQRLRADHPSFRDFDGLIPEYRDSPDTGPEFDSCENGTYFLHKGRRVANARGDNCWLHTACFLRGSEIVKGTSHTRAYSRDSSYITVKLRRTARSRNTENKIARVKHFLRVGAGQQAQRFVVMDVFQNSLLLQDADLGEMYKIAEGDSFELTEPVESIQHKMLVAKNNEQDTYCLKYFFMSATN